MMERRLLAKLADFVRLVSSVEVVSSERLVDTMFSVLRGLSSL